jgi:hypothetical protein
MFTMGIFNKTRNITNKRKDIQFVLMQLKKMYATKIAKIIVKINPRIIVVVESFAPCPLP